MDQKAEVDMSFGFERALLLMREGKKVRLLPYSDIYSVQCDSLLVNEERSFSMDVQDIVNGRWIQV